MSTSIARSLVVFSLLMTAVSARAQPSGLREYRDLKPSLDLTDPIRVLSADKAAELEQHIKAAYANLAPSVVRIWINLPPEAGTDEQGNPLLGGGGSGVIIDRDGLILTCAHSGMAPQAAVTIELADGRRVKGITLGRFELPGDNTAHPDLALARIEEKGDWPAAVVGPAAGPAAGEICLGIGYPGTLPQSRPPLLRLGRVTPRYPEWPWLEATTTYQAGDSGGPLFDLAGRVLGVVNGGDLHAPGQYQAVAPLHEFRDRLIAGEVVAAPSQPIRALKARATYSPAFAPALDLEDTVLSSFVAVRVLNGTRELALGLTVHANGWVLTKRTLVDDCHDLNCMLPITYTGELVVSAKVAASSVEHDLALLKLETRGLPVATWAPEPVAVGQLVTSLMGRMREPVQIAVVGATVAPESNSTVPPQLMVYVVEGPNGEAVIDGLPPGVISAEVDSFRRLFQKGDVLTAIDGHPTPTLAEYGRVLDRVLYAVGADGKPDYNQAAPGSYAGEPVVLSVRRAGQEIALRIIKVHGSSASPLLWQSAPRSIRRDGFPAVFAHDGRLRPEHCGGPVVDLVGRVVGINIARADSTRTLAIPADVVQKVAAELMEQAQATTDPNGKSG